jgi:hypothetical protein
MFFDTLPTLSGCQTCGSVPVPAGLPIHLIRSQGQ